jgi:hypothetical protein
MIQLSDGSTFTARSSSPRGIFKPSKDARNHPMWQPTNDALRNKEKDEAGRLAAFRERFGRGFDVLARSGEPDASGAPSSAAPLTSAESSDAALGGDETSAPEKKLSKRDAAAEEKRRMRYEEEQAAMEGIDPLSDLISGYANADKESGRMEQTSITRAGWDDAAADKKAKRKKKSRKLV